MELIPPIDCPTTIGRSSPRRRDQPLDVADMGATVVEHRRPFAVAMAALIQRDTSKVFAQHYRYAIPGMRVDATAVQEKDRRAGTAPVEVVKAHCADDHLMVVRQPDRVGTKIGDLERGPKHREFIGSLNFHCCR